MQLYCCVQISSFAFTVLTEEVSKYSVCLSKAVNLSLKIFVHLFGGYQALSINASMVRVVCGMDTQSCIEWKAESVRSTFIVLLFACPQLLEGVERAQYRTT